MIKQLLLNIFGISKSLTKKDKIKYVKDIFKKKMPNCCIMGIFENEKLYLVTWCYGKKCNYGKMPIGVAFIINKFTGSSRNINTTLHTFDDVDLVFEKLGKINNKY